MITVAAAGTVTAIAGTTNVVTCAEVVVQEVAAGVITYPIPTPTLIANTNTTIYTAVGAGKIQRIAGLNTSGSNVAVTFLVGGTGTVNKAYSVTVPGNGSYDYESSIGWNVYDSTGIKQYVGTTGPAGTIAVGTVTNVGSAGPPTVTNVGSSTAATLNFGLQQGVTGTTGTAATVAVGTVTNVGSAGPPTVTNVGTSSAATLNFGLQQGSTGSTGTAATVAVGTVSNIGTTGPPTVTNVGTSGAAVLNFGLQQGATGSPGAVNAVTSTNSTIVVTGTTTTNVERAAITGDIGVPANSVVATLPVVNSNVGAFTTANITVNAKGQVTAAASGTSGVTSVSGTAPIVSSGGTTPAISINGATAAAAGSLAAADFGHIPSGWIDVTRQGTNSVLVGNTGSANNTAFAALLTAAPAGSVIYFPPGWYPFASNIALPAKPMVYQGSGSGLNGNLSAFTWTTALGGDKITCGAATSYVQFRDLGFIQQTTPETAGAVVNVNGQANVDFYQCEFTGINATNTLKDCITYGGTNGGLESIVNGCDFTNFSGTAMNANSNLSTIVFDSNTINGGLSGTTGAACGINITLGGAVQIVNSDIIGCTNNLLINPTVGTVVASVWATNTYFDNSFGSCIKITGAGATVRTKFEECSFTTAATASPANAVEVSSTFNYGAAGMGLDFVNCNVLNTFGTLGVGTGFNITGAGDFRIAECEIAAWATGIAVTSSVAAGMTRPTIQNNTIGNAGNYGINTTGISLAVGGGFSFGSVQINGNNLSGNTTPVVDGSGAPSAISGKSISSNIGIANAPMVGAPPTTRSAITVGGTGTLVPGTSLQLPTNAFRIGSVVMFDVSIDKTSVGTAAWVLGVKFGTANTVADTSIATFTTGVNSAAVDMATIKVFLTITAVGSGTSATCTASAIYTKSTGPAALGLGVLPVAGTPVAFNSTLASPFVHIDIIAGTSEVMTANGFTTVLV